MLKLKLVSEQRQIMRENKQAKAKAAASKVRRVTSARKEPSCVQPCFLLFTRQVCCLLTYLAVELAGGSQPAHPQEPQPGYDGGLWKKPLQSERKSRRTEEGQLELTAMQQKREKAKEGRLQDSAKIGRQSNA